MTEIGTFSAPRVPADALARWGCRVLGAVGVPEGQAEVVVDSLVDADLRGTSSHGIRLLATYVPRLQAGDVAAVTLVTTVRDAGAVALLDGGIGLGQVAASEAIELAIRKARTHGVSVVTVRETTHFGALGYFTARAASTGLLALAAQNGPPMVPPFGGVTPLFATNPISYAVPVAGEDPLVFDVATTAVAGNKVQQARQRGEATLPEGWMTDAEGRPTRDVAAAAAGFLQWAGGHKGYGFGLLVEILAGVLADAPVGTCHRTASPVAGRGRLTKGGTFVVIDPEPLLSDEPFEVRMRALVDEIRSSVPASGVERVLVPGDLERARRAEQLERGVALDGSTAALLSELGERIGVGGVPLDQESTRADGNRRE